MFEDDYEEYISILLLESFSEAIETAKSMATQYNVPINLVNERSYSGWLLQVPETIYYVIKRVQGEDFEPYRRSQFDIEAEFELQEQREELYFERVAEMERLRDEIFQDNFNYSRSEEQGWYYDDLDDSNYEAVESDYDDSDDALHEEDDESDYDDLDDANFDEDKPA